MSAPQISVLDAGGQYCHLIARKVRDLGVYAEVRPSDTPAADLAGRRGLIISGGPSSVYEAGSPRIDPGMLAPDFLTRGPAIFGICYGLQLIAHELGGVVRPGQRGEYGLAQLQHPRAHPLFNGVDGDSQVWMSHRDVVESVPPRFEILAATDTCTVAAMAAREQRITAVQFHPEVVHTRYGTEILSNFVFGICACERDWDPKDRIEPIEENIREVAGDRSIFFFVSGGVDSTVAYTLCLRALSPERVYGIYVDTGLMREGETEFVRSLFQQLGATAFHVESARNDFLGALKGVVDPERKRHIIGEAFVAVQERILNSGRFLDGNWILGQGTIYPDTIESGGTANADLIKTHHNRVAGIQKLIESGRIIEPLSSFYKDEVREIGRELGIADEFLHRHPFPGPGLAIRCLCSDVQATVQPATKGWIAPIRSVGVQGDSRSYRAVLILQEQPSEAAFLHATRLANEIPDINRVMASIATKLPLERFEVTRGFLSDTRLERLRLADSVVRRHTEESGFDSAVWQFPVVLVPLGDSHAPDSIVLRPIHSIDGMTAQAIAMPPELLRAITKDILEIEGVCGVFYDLTNKPPATIEWE